MSVSRQCYSSFLAVKVKDRDATADPRQVHSACLVAIFQLPCRLLPFYAEIHPSEPRQKSSNRFFNIKRKSYCHSTTSQLFCLKPDQCRSVPSFGRSICSYFERIDGPWSHCEQAFSVRFKHKVHQPPFFFVSVLAGTRWEAVACLFLPGSRSLDGVVRVSVRPASRLVRPTPRAALLYYFYF